MPALTRFITLETIDGKEKTIQRELVACVEPTDTNGVVLVSVAGTEAFKVLGNVQDVLAKMGLSVTHF